MEIRIFFPYECRPTTCHGLSCIHVGVQRIQHEFESFFICFLTRINYWQHTGQDSDIIDLPVSGWVVWPPNGGHIGSDAGIVICMLLRRLVQDIGLDWREVNLQDACLRFRRFMADEIYAARTS